MILGKKISTYGHVDSIYEKVRDKYFNFLNISDFDEDDTLITDTVSIYLGFGLNRIMPSSEDLWF